MPKSHPATLTPSPEWSGFLTRTAKRYQACERGHRRAVEVTRRKARDAHPETGGCPGLIHNWGNPEARKVWRAFQAEQMMRREIFDAAYHEDWKQAVTHH